MSEDRSWGADTVAFGRGSRELNRPTTSRAQPARPKLPTIALRPLALVTVAIVAVVTLVVAAGGGSDSQKAPIREASDTTPRVVVKQAPRVLRRARPPEPRDGANPLARRMDAHQREPKVSTTTQAQAAPEPTPELPAEPPPEYVAPPAPTPPAAEFGL